MPLLYRVAYRNVECGYDVCYPIGVHLLARWWHRLWEWTHWYIPSTREAELIEAFARGRLEANQQLDREARRFEDLAYERGRMDERCAQAILDQAASLHQAALLQSGEVVNGNHK